jgi:hypothetical protein
MEQQMNLFSTRFRSILPAALLASAVLLCGACASVSVHTKELPPILSQDELLRPYDKAGTITVHRERYGDPQDLTPDDYSWAYHALREEAARIGADAVILPEVKVELERYIFFPTSDMKAKGIAIKFR